MTEQPVVDAVGLDNLAQVFRDDDLPLPARLAAARTVIQLLTEALEAQRVDVAALVKAAPLDDDTLATLYWEFEDLIPARLLGPFHAIRETVESRCPWTYPCPGCGRDQAVTSRSALRVRQRMEGSVARPGSIHPDTCAECLRRIKDERQGQVDAWFERRRVRVHELRTMPYREYLLTPEWQERRRARLRAARFRCQVCNAQDRRLNVHHRTYERRGDEYARDLIVLCEDCHHLFHRNGSLAPHGEGDE
jgi:hypothetical protein